MSANQAVNQERVVRVWNGGATLALWIVLLLADGALLVFSVMQNELIWERFCGVFLLIALIVSAKGFFTLQPNEARVLVLFGSYKGTVRASGFHWGNPFYSDGVSRSAAYAALLKGKPGMEAVLAAEGRKTRRNKVSLRARTLNGETLKVNDKRGNPVEIAAVVVWRVQDTAQAMFDVDDYEKYVPTQSESALRHLASLYPYDDGAYDDGEGEITLRANVDEVSGALRSELQERLSKAGVVVDEARLTHLAYAPEIAQVMLRSQQAEAVISARQKIVHGAVSMVEMALKQLAERDVVSLDDERRAAMVSNLMVVLCSESEVHPVVNTGTLYH
ncbi:MAG TPA: SPFH domain-containing protein [Silvibacterium sp.]|nr:SPFH domain-containing protein [Silvibacterium sp.]